MDILDVLDALGRCAALGTLVEVDKLLGLGGFVKFGLVGVLCICGKKCNFVGYLRWYYS